MERILLSYLKAHEGEWIKKVQLYVHSDNAGYSPETCGRCLRNLANSGKIKVEYYDGKFSKNLAKYAYNPPIERQVKIQIIDGVAHQIYA